MKNSNDTIGNRTRDLPACSAVPQPTAPPRAHRLVVGRAGIRTHSWPSNVKWRECLFFLPTALELEECVEIPAEGVQRSLEMWGFIHSHESL